MNSYIEKCLTYDWGIMVKTNKKIRGNNYDCNKNP